MNKATKGAIAAGAAAVLLLGGLGSLAVWSDTETVDGGTIESGQLNFQENTAGIWTETSVTPNVTIGADPSDFLIVPGDVLSYKTSYTINSEGPNLRANLAADFTNVFDDPTGELAQSLVSEVTVSTGGGPLTSGVAVTIPLTSPTTVVDVTVKLTFNLSTSGEYAQDDSVDLNALALTLTQVRPT